MKLGRKYTTNIKRTKRENNEIEQLKTTQKMRVSNWVLQNYMAPNQRIAETRTETHYMKTNNSKTSHEAIKGSAEDTFKEAVRRDIPSTGLYRPTWHQKL